MTETSSAPPADAPVAAAVKAAMAAMPSAARTGPEILAPMIVRPITATVPGQTFVESEWHFSWIGSPWRLVGPCLFNAFMTVITIGIYSFWGRTEIRRRLWSSVRLAGEPLVYHGTGKELFKGFIGALLIVLLPLFLVGAGMVIAFGQASTGWAYYQLALLAIVYPVLKALAIYRARSYRLARTSWRGMRGSVTGSSAEFAFLSWATSLLYPLTLGWIAPWRALYIQRFLIGDTMLGDRALRLGGSTPRLYLRFGLLWVATVGIALAAAAAIASVLSPALNQVSGVTRVPDLPPMMVAKVIGIVLAALFIWSPISAFYRSSLYNMTANGTTLLVTDVVVAGHPAPRFKLATRSWPLVWLFVTNQIITYGSLFVLRPVAMARSMRYFANNLSIVGVFDPAMIRQNPHGALTEGEGLAQAFDFDAF